MNTTRRLILVRALQKTSDLGFSIRRDLIRARILSRLCGVNHG